MKTILVVDDEPRQRLLYRDAFEDEGYEVVEAGGAEDALDALARQRADLIILDIRMRGTHGLELLAELHQRYPQIPVIMCSAVSALFDDFAVWDAGKQVVGLFEKPVDLGELVSCVGRALQAPSPSEGVGGVSTRRDDAGRGPARAEPRARPAHSRPRGTER